jgi:hypothetical protein
MGIALASRKKEGVESAAEVNSIRRGLLSSRGGKAQPEKLEISHNRLTSAAMSLVKPNFKFEPRHLV